MLRHVAVFTWDPAATDAQKRALVDGLTALPEKIPEIRAYEFGPDAGMVAGNDQFAVTADFDDAAAYLRYAADPAHQSLLADLVLPILAERHAVQFEMGAERRNPSMSSGR